MGIPKSIVDNVQADDNTRITACENDIVGCQNDIASCMADIAALQALVTSLQSAVTTAQGQIATLQGQVAALQTDKANVSGQVFTGAISATNLSGTNTGNQIAAAVPAVTSTNLTYADATGVSILGLGLFPTVAELNSRCNEIKTDFNALRTECTELKSSLVAASPSPLLAT